MEEKRYPATILGTVCIPWTEEFELDQTLFSTQIDVLTAHHLNHLYLFGTAGEGYAVSDRQYEQIVKLFAQQMSAAEAFPMIGLVGLSFRTMLERLEYAHNLGIRDFQFALPSWGALSDSELDTFFHMLCDPYPDSRFLLYNNPRAKRVLSVKEMCRFAENVTNFAGTKFTGADIPAIQAMAAEDSPLRFFLGEKNFAYGSLIGEFGFLISLAISNLDCAWEYFHAGARRDAETLRTMSMELYALLNGFMDIMGRGRIDGAYDKVFSKTLDPAFPLRLLPPYEASTDDQYRAYCRFLKKEYPQWLNQ